MLFHFLISVFLEAVWNVQCRILLITSPTRILLDVIKVLKVWNMYNTLQVLKEVGIYFCADHGNHYFQLI